MMRRFALALVALALAQCGLRIADGGDWGLGIVSAQSAPETAPQPAEATNPQSAILNPQSIRNPQSAIRSAEDATAKHFASIRTEPSLLLAFLNEMPKGGDLHNHLSGAIYAESYLRWAAEDNLCLATATMTIVAAPCDSAAGRPTVAEVFRNAPIFNQAVDAMSMRHWNPALNGHDHFFASFGKFGPPSDKTGHMLAEVAARAAGERVSYLELMLTPNGAGAIARGRAAGFDADFGRLRDRLLAGGFQEVVTEARRRIDVAETQQRGLLRCQAADADAGCKVTIRYISQAGRAGIPEQVFAQLLAGFEMATQDPRFVGINLVQPEDDPTSVRDFPLHMRMIDFLHGKYPQVRIALHAGELVEGLVPPEALRFHIRDSVRVGHASRIGHGGGVMYEDDALGLLREMASKRILVEVALSSNDLILGIKGKRHPLAMYLKYGVPVALVTDDAGVARSSLTLEFRKAVEEQGIDYRTLKRMVRNSIEYAFADDATRTRLKAELSSALATFERRIQSPDRRLPGAEPPTASPQPPAPSPQPRG
jgi:adenosine deaminase